MTHPAPSEDRRPVEEPAGSVRLITIVVAFAAVYAMASFLVPFLLALVLAIAMAPVAAWMERRGLPRTLASLACMLLIGGFLAGTLALISYQLGVIVQKGDVYVDRLGDVSARVVRKVGGETLLNSLTAADAPATEGESRRVPQGRAPDAKDAGDALVARARDAIRGDAREIGRWAVSGLGGALGFAANAVIFLAFLFYMLQGRTEWIERLGRAAEGLGMRPRRAEFAQVAHELKIYLGTLAAVSACYFVIVSAVMWLIGVPQPLLWGVLTAVLEIIPFFGPVIAGALPTVASLAAGTEPWRPLAVVGFFVALQTIEGYVIAPMLYGKAVEIEPVTVILGVLFFGWLLGPAGLVLAMPLMILLRGVLIMTPDTPALDALTDADEAAKV